MVAPDRATKQASRTECSPSHPRGSGRGCPYGGVAAADRIGARLRADRIDEVSDIDPAINIFFNGDERWRDVKSRPAASLYDRSHEPVGRSFKKAAEYDLLRSLAVDDAKCNECRTLAKFHDRMAHKIRERIAKSTKTQPRRQRE